MKSNNKRKWWSMIGPSILLMFVPMFPMAVSADDPIPDTCNVINPDSSNDSAIATGPGTQQIKVKTFGYWKVCSVGPTGTNSSADHLRFHWDPVPGHLHGGLVYSYAACDILNNNDHVGTYHGLIYTSDDTINLQPDMDSDEINSFSGKNLRYTCKITTYWGSGQPDVDYTQGHE
jgi:hypothetical protein